VLHDIAVGPFAEQPAGKIAPPFAVGRTAHVQLHEGAGFLYIFPGRAGFASLQPHDRVADPQRFTGLHAEIASEAVALVEQADHGDSLRHRRTLCAGRGALPDRGALNADGAGLIRGGNIIAATGGEHQRDRTAQDRREHPRRLADHDASGLQAS
jgi:hypothetical protein